MSPRLVVLLLVKLPPLLPTVTVGATVTGGGQGQDQVQQSAAPEADDIQQSAVPEADDIQQSAVPEADDIQQSVVPEAEPTADADGGNGIALPKSLPLPLWVKRLFIPVFITVMVKNIPMETFKFKPSLLGWRLPFR